MNIDEKKQQINDLMTEYSQKKSDPANKIDCVSIKSRVANIMYSTDFFKFLFTKVKHIVGNRSTNYQPDEFITETFILYVDEYDYNMNNNFFAFFMKYLRYTISNMLRKEHPDIFIENVIEDDEGHEKPIIETVPDNTASPETLSLINSLSILFGDIPSTETDAKSILHFCNYLAKIIPCILNVKKHQKKNAKSYEYFSAFATDFFISICKMGLSTKYDINENDVFATVDLAFADFTLVKQCRSFKEFIDSPCKEYSDLGLFPKPDEKKSENQQLYCVGELHVPFRNPVYRVYHRVNTDGSISQQRTKFQEILWKYGR